MTTISIELDDEQEKKLEEYASRFKVDKQDVLSFILNVGLKEGKIHTTLENLRKEKRVIKVLSWMIYGLFMAILLVLFYDIFHTISSPGFL